jgi:hypothetical protein
MRTALIGDGTGIGHASGTVLTVDGGRTESLR